MELSNMNQVAGASKGGKVVHTYTDYATADMKMLVEKEHPVHAPGPGGDPPFPVKLHHVLKELKTDGQDSIVGWQPHGRCFIVGDTKEFADRVLPSYFRQTKLQSFQRQLNLYGFKRLTQGPDKGGYYHELFLRGQPELAARITRTTVKNKGPRKAASPSTEPNLYVYPAVHDEDVACTISEKKEQTPVLKPLETPQFKAGATASRFTHLFTQTSALLAEYGMPSAGRPVVSPMVGMPTRVGDTSGARFDRSVSSNAMSLLALSGFIAHGEASLPITQTPPRGLNNPFGFSSSLSFGSSLQDILLSRSKNLPKSTPGLFMPSSAR